MNAVVAKTSRTLHWISSALGLASLLFFSATGITLNHPGWFTAQPASEFVSVQMDADWMASFARADEPGRLALLAREVGDNWGLPLPRNIETDEYEWMLDYQRPGGLATVVLELDSGLLSLERVDDGLVALINDLHKGRHSGAVWSLLIDVTAVVCLLFAITGILLLIVHAGKRPSTWPLVGLGTVLPVLLYYLFVP